MIDLTGKSFVIFGVANDKSIAWHIVLKLMACGGTPILCSHPIMQERVEKLAAAHRIGDVILCSQYYGRVRALINEEGKRLKEAGPSVAVKVLGLNGVPEGARVETLA